MIPDEDPLWYDREESEPPMQRLAMLCGLVLVSLACILFFPLRLWEKLKRGVVVAFRDVEPVSRRP